MCPTADKVHVQAGTPCTAGDYVTSVFRVGGASSTKWRVTLSNSTSPGKYLIAFGSCDAVLSCGRGSGDGNVYPPSAFEGASGGDLFMIGFEDTPTQCLTLTASFAIQ